MNFVVGATHDAFTPISFEDFLFNARRDNSSMLVFGCRFGDGTFAVDNIVNSVQSKFEDVASPVTFNP